MKIDMSKYNWVTVANYTPHTVTLLGPAPLSYVRMRFDSIGVARCAEIIEQLTPFTWDSFGDSGMTDSLPRVSKRFGDVTGLPEPKDNILYIVSQIVADACPNRCDLLVPSDIIRDGAGQVIGCRSFSWRDGN